MVSFSRWAVLSAPAFALFLILGADTGKHYLRRLAIFCIHNIYADHIEILKIPHNPRPKHRAPAYIALCQHWLSHGVHGDRRLDGEGNDSKVITHVSEDDNTCVDWSSPHQSMMDITAALIVQRYLPSTKYRHNCDRTRVYDEASVGFDHSTIQQIISTPSLGLEDSLVDEEAVKNQCRRCLMWFDPQTELLRISSKAHHHCFTWPAYAGSNKDVNNIPDFPANPRVTPLSMVIKPLTQRYYHAAMEWRDVADKPSQEESSGVVIYLDQSTLGIDYEHYVPHIPAGSTSISIIGGPLCATATLKTGQNCLDYGRGLADYLSPRYPNIATNGIGGGHGCSFQMSASTAGISSRLSLAQLTICAPHTSSCYLPAMSKMSGNSVVLEDPNWKKAIDFFTITGSQGRVRVVELAASQIPPIQLQVPDADPALATAPLEFAQSRALCDDEGYPTSIQVPQIPDTATVLRTPDKEIVDRVLRKIGDFNQNPNVQPYVLEKIPSQNDIKNAMLRQLPLPTNVIMKSGWGYNGRAGELSLDVEHGYSFPLADFEYLQLQNNFRFDSMSRIQHDYNEAAYNFLKGKKNGPELASVFEVKCPITSQYVNGNVVTEKGDVKYESGEDGTKKVDTKTNKESDEDNKNVPNGVPFREGDGYKVATGFGFNSDENSSLKIDRRRRMVAVDARTFKFGDGLHRICNEQPAEKKGN